MKCMLDGKVSHANVREAYRRSLLSCSLLEDKGTRGMVAMGVICSHCYLRIFDLRQAKAHLLLQGTLTPETLSHYPELLKDHLPEHLAEYFSALQSLGKSMKGIDDACARCRAVPVKDTEE